MTWAYYHTLSSDWSYEAYFINFPFVLLFVQLQLQRVVGEADSGLWRSAAVLQEVRDVRMRESGRVCPQGSSLLLPPRCASGRQETLVLLTVWRIYSLIWARGSFWGGALCRGWFVPGEKMLLFNGFTSSIQMFSLVILISRPVVMCYTTMQQQLLWISTIMTQHLLLSVNKCRWCHWCCH